MIERRSAFPSVLRTIKKKGCEAILEHFSSDVHEIKKSCVKITRMGPFLNNLVNFFVRSKRHISLVRK